MNRNLILKYLACAILVLFSTVARSAPPFAIATYHSLGLYWTPEPNTSTADALVRYREQGTTAWRDALPMQHHVIDGTTNELAPYRGSIVHLQSGTTYEVELRVDGTDISERLITSTRSEEFPVGATVRVPDRTTQFDITESGTADAYRVYDGTGTTIDVGNAATHTITINASHVIVRGFNLKGAASHGIRILGGHDIIIEDCDISGWGAIDFDGDYGQNYQSAIFSNNRDIARVTVQRCKIHHPRHDSNSWAEFNCNSPNNCSYHAAGPQAIAFFDSAGNHVLRYNEVWSDADHYYNDILGFGENGSFEGFPGPDSDIYGNYLANCWDDGIEAEGGGRNVRIWNNYVENCFMALANAATSIGPLYIWRNVSGPCNAVDYAERGRDVQGNFLKMGYAGSEDWMTGHSYIFHNTILNGADDGCHGLGGSSRIIKHTTTRNNVLHVRSTDSHSIAESQTAIANDFDHDLYSHQVPAGAEASGIQGVPVYTSDSQWQLNERIGRFQHEEGSLGFDTGVVIANFNDRRNGAAPDMGAHETGWPAVLYGTKASTSPPPSDGCGAPEITGSSAAGLYAWRECTENSWRVMVLSRGQIVEAFVGSITSDVALTELVPIQFEASDELTRLSSVAGKFTMRAVNNGSDQIKFQSLNASNLCLTLSQNSVDSPIFLGQSATQKQLLLSESLDLITGKTCL